MAQSRIEKFREYRKSILSDGSPVLQTEIETSLEATSTESKTTPTDKEAVFLSKISSKKNLVNILLISYLVIAVAAALVFGFILFK